MPSAPQPSPTRAALTVSAALALLLLPGTVHAQQGCSFAEGSERMRIERDPRGGNVTRLTRPHFECADGVEIWSDSTVVYQFDRMALLYGSVRYVDAQREMRADRGRYFYEVGRFQAQGNVLVTNFEDGSTVENGDLVFLRETDFRDVEEMTVTTGADGVRPRATVFPRRADPEPDEGVDEASADTAATPDSANVEPAAPDAAAVAPPAPDPPDPDAAPAEAPPREPAEPQEYVIVADRIFFRGDSYFDATGTVEIVRDSLFAYADSAEYTGDEGALVLDGSARVVGSSYDLVGRRVTLRSEADGSDEVRALRDAELTGEDLSVTAPQIVLHLLAGELERMVAVPLAAEVDSAAVSRTAPGGDAARDTASSADSARTARPYAISEDIELTGDSLDLAAPGGVLERIFAAGSARSISTGRPELNVEVLPEMARRDWIDADTIEVLLVPTAADSTGQGSTDDYQVERILARVGARSLYRLVPSDSTAVVGVDPPAVSYMVADRITIFFMADGQAERVESVGQVSGWHLEPLARPAEAPEDGDPEAAPDAGPPGSASPPADPPPEPVPIAGGDAGLPGA